MGSYFQRCQFMQVFIDTIITSTLSKINPSIPLPA